MAQGYAAHIEAVDQPSPGILNRIGFKVGMGMALLLGLFAVMALVSILQALAVDAKVHEITEIEEPTSAAAYEMEINVIDTGLGVLKYIQTGNGIHRQRVAKYEANFERFEAQYDLLAETARDRELGEQVSVLFQQYNAMGYTLMDQADRREILFAVLGDNFETIDEILDEEIQANVDLLGPDGTEKLIESLHMEVNIAEMGTWLGNYLRVRKPEYVERLYDDAKDFREELESFKSLRLTEEEVAHTVELEDLFNENVDLSAEIVALEDGLDANLAQFVDLRIQLDAVLDEEILAQTHQDLAQASQVARGMESQAITVVLALLVSGLALGVLVAVIITRGITGPVNKLVLASRAIANGDLFHRVDIRSKDEFGTLARDFNEMVVQRRRAQEELQERTEELVQSQKMEAIGTLAGGVAHDFNNMLSAILSYAHLASADIENGRPIAAYLDEIRKAGERSTDLTRKLLAFSRRQIFSPEIVNLNDLISDIEKLLARMIGENIIIETRLAKDLSSVRIDRAQVEQVVMNMAVNGRDAMPKGGTLVLETTNTYVGDSIAGSRPELDVGPYVTIQVSDNGAGMPKAVLDHIFEPFYTSKEMGKGSGLGLSMCDGIVAQSGGHIAVKSDLGAGTTFTVYLPAVDEIAEGPASNREDTALPKGKESVLLVEDEPIVRRVAMKILCNQGYVVEEATNGEEALEILSKHPENHFDILVTDVIMPKMGGRELAERFRETHPRTSVLYMTGYTEDDIFLQGILDDHCAIIQKPFTPNKLAQQVRDILDA